MKERIARYIGSKDVGVYFIDIETGINFGINEDKIFYAASIAKLPALLYTQKLINEGRLNETTEYQYFDYINDIPGAMIRGGTGILQNKTSEGDSIDIKTLMLRSASNSDNLASNMLSYYVCNKNSGKFKEYISTVIGRNLHEFKKEFSAKEAAFLINNIYCEGGLAVEYLENTDWDNVKIPKYLPVKCAHKVGFNGEYNHDVAVIYYKKPYILSIMTSGENDEFISKLALQFYCEFGEQS